MELFNIFIKSVFIDNMIFAYFLGMCSYLAVSKTVKTSFGLGVAVTFVLLVTVPFSFLVPKYLQIRDMVIEKFSPTLYAALGIFLPLIAVNCAILGCSLFMQDRGFHNVGEAAVYGLGSGVGWLLAIVGIAAIREKIRYSHIPKGLQGVGISFIITGLMGIAFMAFLGIKI